MIHQKLKENAVTHLGFAEDPNCNPVVHSQLALAYALLHLTEVVTEWMTNASAKS